MECKRCKAPLEENARFCPVCGTVQPLICPACGAESRPGSRLCSKCGKKLPLPPKEERMEVPRRKKVRDIPNTLVSIAVALLGGCLLLGAVWLLYSTLTGRITIPSQEEQPPQIQEEVQPPAEPELAEPEEVPVEIVKPSNEEKEPQVEEEAPAEEENEVPVEEETPVEEEPPAEDDQWIFPDSDTRLLTEADCAGLSAWELKVARNEIYARHGRRFNNQELQAHFNSCDWYSGTIAPNDFDESVLSQVELDNLATLRAAE